MATSPDQVREGLLIVTAAAGAELASAATEALEQGIGAWRATLFAAAPLVLAEYAPAAASLAADWYEEIRFDSGVTGSYAPTLRLKVTDDDARAMVARVTRPLWSPDEQREIDAEVEALVAEATRLAVEAVEKQVADGFRDTVLDNTRDDPAAAGWKRFARPDACKFCLMLAARGAVYTEQTARFAAHGAEMRGGRKGGNCMCIAGPEFGGKEIWAAASPMQYLASRRKRSAADRARVRAHLNENFPDAPG